MHQLSDLCFLCLIRTKDIKSVLSTDEDNIIIEEKVEFILSELINFRPDLPKTICNDCLKGLDYVYKFKHKCLDNLVTLNEYLEKSEAHFVVSSLQQSKSDKKFICDICHKNFSQTSNLKDHLLTHTNIKAFKCNICDYKCSRSSSLKRHIKIHSTDRHTCTFCQQSFSSVTYLHKHVKAKHTENGEENVENQNNEVDIVVKVEPADLQEVDGSQNKAEDNSQSKKMVPNGFVDTSGQTPSQQSEDDFRKPFKCSHCTKSFRDKYNLQTHLRIHSGERPYQCKTCLKTFSQSSVLKSHERIHTGEKPYSCEVCSKCFADVGTLIKHKRVHNNLRPYKCTVCEKRFKLSGHRSKHMVNVHGCVREPYEIKY